MERETAKDLFDADLDVLPSSLASSAWGDDVSVSLLYGVEYLDDEVSLLDGVEYLDDASLLDDTDTASTFTFTTMRMLNQMKHLGGKYYVCFDQESSLASSGVTLNASPPQPNPPCAPAIDLTASATHITFNEEAMATKDEEIAQLKNELEMKEDAMAAKDKKIAKLEHEKEVNEVAMAAKGKEIAQLKHELEETKNAMVAKDEEVAKLVDEKEVNEKAMVAKDEDIARLKRENEELELLSEARKECIRIARKKGIRMEIEKAQIISTLQQEKVEFKFYHNEVLKKYLVEFQALGRRH